MPPRAIIPAAIVTAPTPERQHFVNSSAMHDNRNHQAGPSTYGSISTRTSPGSQKGKEPAVDFDLDRCDSESCNSDDEEDSEPLVDSMSSRRVGLMDSDLETYV
jgi:hypothetical protein